MMFKWSCSLRRISTVYLLINLLIFTSCIAAIVDYSKKYFAYGTKTKIAPYVPIEQPVPKLSLCFTYHTLLEPKLSYSFFVKPHEVKLLDRISNLTVTELFRSTPDTPNVVQSCRIRLNKTSSMSRLNGSQCLEHLKISKYITRRYVCYLIEPMVSYNNYDLLFISSHFHFRRALYEVSIESPLSEGNKILPALTFEKLPYEDNFFVTEILPSRKNEYFILAYDLFIRHSLEKPYDTGCMTYPVHFIHLVANCVNKKIPKNSFLYPQTHLFQPVDLPFGSFETFWSGKVFPYSQLQDCWKYFDPPLCKSFLSITIKSPPMKSPEKLTFSVEGAKFPVYLQKTYPLISLNEFLIQFFTVFGVWLGGSIFGLSHVFRSAGKFLFLSARSVELAGAKQIKQLISTVKALLEKKLTLESKLEHQMEPAERKKCSRELFRPRMCKRKVKCHQIIFLLSLSVKMLVFVSLIVQLVLVLAFHFKYKTIATFSHLMWPVAKVPNLDFCFGLSRLFNSTLEETIIEAENVHKLFKTTYFDQLTLAEMLKIIPPVSSVISGCRVRKNLFQLVEHRNASYCLSKFGTARYFLKRQICYRFRFKNNDKRMLFWYKNSDSFDSGGIIYSLILSKMFTQFQRIEIIVNIAGFPEFTHKFSSEIFHRTVKRLILISYSHQEFWKLSWPYDTNCYHMQNGQSCTSRCMINQTLEQLGHLPYSELLFTPYPNRILTYADLKMNSTASKFQQIEFRCFEKCKMSPCNFILTRTFVSQDFRSDHNLELALHTQLYPDVLSEAKPIVTLLETLYMIVCFIAFWLGFSLISLNPSEIWFKAKKRKVTCLFNRLAKNVNRIVFLLELWTFEVRKNLHLKFNRLVRTSPIEVGAKCNGNIFIFRIFCSVGCFTSVFFSVRSYLSYPTVIKTEMGFETNFHANQLSVCLQMNQLGLDVYNLTTKELFQLTPSTAEIINYCGHRGIQNYQNYSPITTDRIFVSQTNVEKCKSTFFIEKYLMQNFVCYLFRYKYPPKIERIQSFLNRPRMLYSIGIDIKYITEEVTVTVASGFPVTSSIWSPVIITDKRIPGWYTVSYVQYSHRILPKPYDSEGYHSSVMAQYIKSCTRAKLASTKGQESPEHLIKSPSDMFYSKYDQEYIRIRNSCIDHFIRGPGPEGLRDDYWWNMFVTTVSQKRFNGRKPEQHHNAMLFVLLSTNYQVITSVFEPMLSSFNLFLEVGSIISIWFGLSVIDCNPFTLLMDKLKIGPRKSLDENIKILQRKIEQLEDNLQKIEEQLRSVQVKRDEY